MRSSASARQRAASGREQTLAAHYWAENPPVTWSRAFRTVSAQQGLSARRERAAVRDALHDRADALISVWDDKAHWSFWRPITAIREADTDGNSATDAGSGWRR